MSPYKSFGLSQREIVLDVNPKPVTHFHLQVAKAFAMPSIPVRTTLSALIREWEGPYIQGSVVQVTLLRATVTQRLWQYLLLTLLNVLCLWAHFGVSHKFPA